MEVWWKYDRNRWECDGNVMEMWWQCMEKEWILMKMEKEYIMEHDENLIETDRNECKCYGNVMNIWWKSDGIGWKCGGNGMKM